MTSPVTSAHRGGRSRRAILDAALPIFAKHGYAAASLNQIIEASGLTKGGFYFHFASKQALALAVLEDQRGRWIAQLGEELDRYPRAVDRLFAAPRALAVVASRHEGPFALGKLVDELARDPDLRDEVCDSIRTWIEVVTEHFAAAQAEGAIHADIDPAAIAQVAVGTFVGMQAITDQLGDGRLLERVELMIEIIQRASLVSDHDGSDQHELRRDHRGGPGGRRRDRDAAGE